jgi:hypothetical protein
MTSRKDDVSLRQAAKTAGFGLLAMMPPAIFTNFFVLQGLVVTGDAGKTAANIMANELLFRLGIGCLIIVIILDVVVAWGLWVFLRPVSKSVSLLAAWFRLLYTAVFAVALLYLAIPLRFLSGAEYLSALGTEPIYAQALLSLDSFTDGWAIGYASFFGLHLFLLGYLVLKSEYVPRLLGVLLIISSLAYVIDNSALLIMPGYEDYQAITSMVVFLPAFIGEFAFMLWLLFRGGKTPPKDADSA